MKEEDLLTAIEQAFNQVFQGRVAFSGDLERDATRQWDSLKHIELMIALESLFEVRLDGADVTEMVDVGSIARILASRCSNSS